MHSPSKILMVFLLAACSADPESTERGSCALSCGKPKVGGAEFVVESLLSESTAGVSISCLTENAQPTAVEPALQARYRVYEKVPGFAASVAGGAEGGAEAAAAGGLLATPLLEKRPVAGIGFEPQVFGILNLAASAEGYDPNTKTVTPGKFGGVVTPSSEWCSDACGVMTYEVKAMCLPGGDNKITAGISVHGVMPKSVIEFSLGDARQ